jgi:cytochrome c553
MAMRIVESKQQSWSNPWAALCSTADNLTDNPFLVSLTHPAMIKPLLLLVVTGASSLALAQQPAAKVDIAKGQTIAAQVCAACHAADGNSTAPINPKLAGQHPEYLAKQLANFKVKAGAKEAERANAVMAGFAATLSDEDMRNVSAYFASQKLKPAQGSGDKAAQELGQKIWRGGIASKNVPACASCHGPAGKGVPAQYPYLGGQWADYTEAQMIAFRQGVRKNAPMMATIAARMSDAEIKAVSNYAASLR